MKIALLIQYAGHDYYGWQAQEGLSTIEGCLTKAVSQIADETVTLTVAGRTDKGVHALGQVVHFQTQNRRTLDSWRMGINAKLPASIKVLQAFNVADHFNARYSALSRHYLYVINNHQVASAIFYNQTTWHYTPLNEHKMHQAAQLLVGEHDFTSFRDSQCQAKHAVRRMIKIGVTRKHNFVMVEVCANAFLHHMVRNIVGTLLPIGEGRLSVNHMANILKAQDRSQAGITAPANGLYLHSVQYTETDLKPQRSPPLLLL